MSIYDDSIGKVSFITTRDGRKFASRLAEYDGKHLKFIFSSGLAAYILADNISYVMPLRNQPTVVI